ncbi:MAG: endonuclease/exonuclease/phosphatase family protein [Omnitrophica WOR_2 bacterium]
MSSQEASGRNHLVETLFFGLLFLFFFQLLTDFVAAIYAFGLSGVSIPPEIIFILILFTPLLLVFTRKSLGSRTLTWIVVLVLVCRIVESLLPTRERMLVSGLGTGVFLVFFPALLGGRSGEASGAVTLGLGLFSGLAFSILLRAAGSGIDLSTMGMYQIIAWGLALLAAYLLLIRPGAAILGVEAPAQRPPVSFARTAGLSLGITAVFILLYFAFTAPGVIARWTGISYLLVLALPGFALVAGVFLLLILDRMQTSLAASILVAWNLLFVFCLALTLWLRQVRFPGDPSGYPLYEPGHPAWQILPLVFTLLLFPVLLFDFIAFCRGILALRPSTPRLGAGFSLASLVLLLLILAQVFTTTYDYIPMIGPYFRDGFWLVFLAAGVCLLLPLLAIDWKRISKLAGQRDPSLRVLPALLGALTLLGLVLAVLNHRSPQASVSPADPSQRRLVVLTYNIQQGYSAAGQKNHTGQLELMRQVDADIIGLQETDTSRISGGNDDTIRFLSDRLGLNSYYGPDVVAGTFGIALLSKYPIQNPRTFYMYSRGEQTAAITAQITKAGKTFNVLVTHLGNGGPLVQQEEVLKELAGKPDVLVMGDFNFDPSTDQYRRTVQVLSDAWLLRWPTGIDDRGYNPVKRIDHIFVSPGTQVTGARFLTAPESDHPALTITIAW